MELAAVAIAYQHPCIFLQNDCFSKKQKVEKAENNTTKKARWS